MARRLLLWSAVVEAVLATACVGVLLNRVPVVALANIQQIKQGMTLSEVELVLGYPPGDYMTGHYSGSVWLDGETVFLDGERLEIPPRIRGAREAMWQFGEGVDSCLIWVGFDASGKVICGCYYRSWWPRHRGWMGRALAWLDL